MKKTKLSILFFAVLLTCSSHLMAQNFSGTWARNTGKTDAGNLSINSVPFQLSVSQSKYSISIKRTATDKQNDTTTYTEELKFDGSVATSIVKPNVNKKASIKWSDDRKTFTVMANYTNEAGNPTQKGEEVWSLSGDGKTLTIRSTLDVNGQTYLMTEVFDK